MKSKSVEKSDNNTGSNDEEEDNESIGFNIGDGSDDGSGTQVLSVLVKRLTRFRIVLYAYQRVLNISGQG